MNKYEEKYEIEASRQQTAEGRREKFTDPQRTDLSFFTSDVNLKHSRGRSRWGIAGKVENSRKPAISLQFLSFYCQKLI